MSDGTFWAQEATQNLTYIHSDQPRFLCVAVLTTSTSVSMYVKPGQHTCMLSAFIGEHTYTPTNLGHNIHTGKQTQIVFFSMYVRKTPTNLGSKHTYIHTHYSPVALTNLLNLIVLCWIKADSRLSNSSSWKPKMPEVAASPKLTKFCCKRTVWVVSGGSTNLLNESLGLSHGLPEIAPDLHWSKFLFPNDLFQLVVAL